MIWLKCLYVFTSPFFPAINVLFLSSTDETDSYMYFNLSWTSVQLHDKTKYA